MTETKKKTLTEIVKELESKVQCNCDLDKWEPERSTWHTLECRIHLLAMEKLKRN